MADDITDRLRTIPLFAGLDYAALRHVTDISTVLELPKGSVLIERGLAGSGMYVVLDGMAEVELRHRTVELGPGEVVGELALLTDQPNRTAPRSRRRRAALPGHRPHRVLGAAAVAAADRRADALDPRPAAAGRAREPGLSPGAIPSAAMSAQSTTAAPAAQAAPAAGKAVLITLASAQFLMTLDSSVMNVSIATVAEDVGTTVTGIQTRDHRSTRW